MERLQGLDRIQKKKIDESPRDYALQKYKIQALLPGPMVDCWSRRSYMIVVCGRKGCKTAITCRICASCLYMIRKHWELEGELDAGRARTFLRQITEMVYMIRPRSPKGRAEL